MAGITGQGTTFNLPNYVGELFSVTPTDTPFLSAIGGLTGGRPADSTLFQWQKYDLRDADATRQRVEGANAPTAEERVRANVINVVEIHQEAIEISYTKLAAVGQYNTTGSSHPGSVGIGGSNPVLDEEAWQTEQALKQIARDVEVSFLNNSFANPATNASARKTQGIIGAITTNVVNANNAPLTEDMVLDLMQSVWEQGGIMESETATLMCNGGQKRKLTEIFVTDKNYQEMSRTVGGVAVSTILTDFGTVNIMLNRHMPTDTIIVVSLDECAPRFLPIPGKGFLFVEDLGRAGAAIRKQIYGEIGLEYGLEQHHGKIYDLNTTGS
jgi:hypothetical protein